MKNKYQEALDYVNKSVCTALSCLGIDDEQSRKSLHILQKLVDKETPMKPIYENDLVDENIVVDTWAYCPKCKEEIDHDRWGEKYCSHCGQKIDWSDTNE